MPHDGDSVAASAARLANIARLPVCSCSVRMSGVFGHALGRK